VFSKYAKIAMGSKDTALRDIVELLERGILAKNPGGGRSTSYRRLADLNEI
jgi:Fic family protein